MPHALFTVHCRKSGPSPTIHASYAVGEPFGLVNLRLLSIGGAERIWGVLQRAKSNCFKNEGIHRLTGLITLADCHYEWSNCRRRAYADFMTCHRLCSQAAEMWFEPLRENMDE